MLSQRNKLLGLTLSLLLPGKTTPAHFFCYNSSKFMPSSQQKELFPHICLTTSCKQSPPCITTQLFSTIYFHPSHEKMPVPMTPIHLLIITHCLQIWNYVAPLIPPYIFVFNLLFNNVNRLQIVVS